MRRKRKEPYDGPESMRPRHTPFWPSMRDTAIGPSERVLAFMARDGHIGSEDGRRWPAPATWDALRTLLFEERLQLFVGAPIALWLADWWGEALAELVPEATTEVKKGLEAQGRASCVVLNWSPSAGQVVSLTAHLKCRNRAGRLQWQTRHIVQSSCWGAAEPSGALLSDLRELFRLLETGTATTPGSCGAATMFHLWQAAPSQKIPFPRHHRPTSECLRDLHEHAVGSYKDAWRPYDVFQEVWELDRTNGFAAETRLLPAGTVRGPLLGGHARDLLARGEGASSAPPIPCFTFFAHCRVRIAAPGIPRGDVAPFLVRRLPDGDAHSLVTTGEGRTLATSDTLFSPRQPGLYDCWLWKEEADEIARRRLEEGCPISIEEIDHAWYWEHATDQLAGWAERLDRLRREAPAAISGLVKVCMVAAIGRLGMSPLSYLVSASGSGDEAPDADAILGDRRSIEAGGPDAAPLSLSVSPQDVGAPKHWHAYILMKQNQSVLRVAHEAYLAQLEVIGVNVDAVVCVREPARLGVPLAAAQLGDYRRRTVGDGLFYAMVGPGIQISPAKLKTPGLTPSHRREIMLHGVPPPPKGSQVETHATVSRIMRAAFNGNSSTEDQRQVTQMLRLREWYLGQCGPPSTDEVREQWAPIWRLERRVRGWRHDE